MHALSPRVLSHQICDQSSRGSNRGDFFFYDPTINTVAAKSFSAYFIKWINNVDFFE